MDSLRRWDQRDDRGANTLDQSQVMTREIPVEQFHRCGECHDSNLSELLELDRRQPGERYGLAELQFSLIGLKCVLIKLIDILQQSRRAGQSSAILASASIIPANLHPERGVPVVILDIRRRYLLPLKGELGSGKLRNAGRLR